MADLKIQYRFLLANQKKFTLDLCLDRQSLIRKCPDRKDHPEWVGLEFQQCSNCPLKSDNTPNCPVAVSLVDIVEPFDESVSYDELDLQVVTQERCISQHTTVQQAVSSLIGLIMATSGCPHTRFFKPMARFHLPLASEEETVCRAVSMYLLAQYFIQQQGGKADLTLSGLSQIYEAMQQVNLGIVGRLRAASETDSSINAAIILDMYTHTIPMIIEDSLDEVRYLFDDYMKG